MPWNVIFNKCFINNQSIIHQKINILFLWLTNISWQKCQILSTLPGYRVKMTLFFKLAHIPDCSFSPFMQTIYESSILIVPKYDWSPSSVNVFSLVQKVSSYISLNDIPCSKITLVAQNKVPKVSRKTYSLWI